MHIFPTSVFLIIDIFSPLLEKRIEQLLPQSLEPTRSVLSYRLISQLFLKCSILLRRTSISQILLSEGVNSHMGKIGEVAKPRPR